jgi:hypothetical protein
VTTIDTYYRRFVNRFKPLFGSLFGHLIKGAAVSRSVYSQRSKKGLQPFDDRVELASESYAVVFTANNRAGAPESARFATQNEAQEWLRTKAATDRNLGAKLHVVPGTEMSEAA